MQKRTLRRIFLYRQAFAKDFFRFRKISDIFDENHRFHLQQNTAQKRDKFDEKIEKSENATVIAPLSNKSDF